MSGRSVTDLFAGAGGSSTGLTGAGLQVVIAANHWQLAVDTHALNHPDTEHDCADISAVDPRRYPRTDLLWASPECTNHSIARGYTFTTGQLSLLGGDEPDPAAERSRATMWDVHRFAEAMHLRGRPYEAVIVENVIEVRRWLGWRAWLLAMGDLGYDHQVVYLNSAFAHGKDYHGAPQYRDRIYVVFTRRGAPRPDLDIRPPGWCPRCQRTVDAVQAWKKPDQPWGRYRAQYVYQCPAPACRAQVEPFTLPAAAAIDWTDLGGRIGDRARPLAPATRERIRAGLARYGRPLLTPAGGTWNEHARPADDPFRARTTRETEGITCPPMLIPTQARAELTAGRDATATPWPTQTGRAELGIAVPAGFVLRNNTARGDQGQMATRFDEPLRTLTTTGHQSVVTIPDALLMPYYGTGVARPVHTPGGTVTTRDRHALIIRTAGQVSDDEVDECTFRMLAPGEIGAAMAFPADYQMRGAKRDRVRMYGNAVTPPAARLLAERITTALNGAA